MAKNTQPLRKHKRKPIRGKIRLSQRMQLVRKDKLRVARGENGFPEAPTQMPRDNGLNMRVKIRRKTK